MTKKLLTFLTLLTLFFGVGWAEETLYYTLDGAITDGNNGYATVSEITQNGMEWEVTGNTTVSPWRIGGKNLKNAYRPISSQTAMGSAISKVTVELGASSSMISIGGIYLFVYSDAGHTNQLDSVLKTPISANSTIEFTPTSGTEWPTGAYYMIRFTINVNSANNNYVEFKNAKFYKNDGGSTPDPTTYSLTLPTGLTGGTVTATGASDLTAIPENTSITVTATPSSDSYELDWMKADGTEVSNPYTFNITANTTITAAFKEKQVTPTPTYTNRFERITSTDDLEAGVRYLLVYETTPAVMGAISTTNTKYGMSITSGFTLSNGVITLASTTDAKPLTLGGSTGAWTFDLDGNTLAWTSGNSLITGNNQNTWSISFSGNDVVISNAANNNRQIGYNPTSGQNRFATYDWPNLASNTTIVHPQLYKEVEETAEVPDLYILGQVNGNDLTVWNPQVGQQLTYNNTNKVYAADIYCTGLSNDGNNNITTTGYSYFAFATELNTWDNLNANNAAKRYGSGASGDYWGIGGENESEFDSAIPLYQGSQKSYRLPAGLYTVTVDLTANPNTVTVAQRDVTMTVNDNTSGSTHFDDSSTATLASNLTDLGGKIYYTTDGTTPTATNGNEYSEPINITATTTVKAIAILGAIQSEIAERNFIKKPAAPVITPNGGTIYEATQVTITAEEGATIYYTTDGSTPTSENGTLYESSFTVSATTTVKARAYVGDVYSNVTTAEFTYSDVTPSTGDFVLVTSADQLVAGNEYIIMTIDKDDYELAMGDLNGNNKGTWTQEFDINGTVGEAGSTVSIYSESTTVRSLVNILELENTDGQLSLKQQSAGTYLNITGNSTDINGSASKTYLTIAIEENNIATIKGYSSRQILYSDQNEVFGNYASSNVGTSGYSNIYLYTRVADNSEYTLVNNIAEFLALKNGTKAKFNNSVTVLYDYAQRGNQEYIWVKDESGYMQFFLQPTLNSSTENTLDAKAAYYENGDIIPAGFVVVKNYYENGKYVQAYSAEALDAKFLPATQKGLADPEYMDFNVLRSLDASDSTDVATWSNHYITVEKVKIETKSDKNFTFADENGTVNACVGFNKYNGDGSLLKDGTTSADVIMPTDLTKFYDVKAILQVWQGGWEILPIEFTEWKAEDVTLRKLCADGVEQQQYTISNRLLGVYYQGNHLWVKDDNGQSIWMKAPAEGDNNYEIGELAGNKQLDQSLYDQSNWLEIVLADGSSDADLFIGRIIKGSAITGTFTNKLNPTMTGVTLTEGNMENTSPSGKVDYTPNFYCTANFFNGLDGGHQTCAGGQDHGDFFFMNPKPQEYTRIVWAQYKGDLTMEMPTGTSANEHGFNGEFTIDLSLNGNQFDPNSAKVGDSYNFYAIVRRNVSSKGNSSEYKVYPVDLQSGVITAVTDVTGKTVATVRYYNLAGIESERPFDGVNIIVTTYTDGSRSSQKVLR